MKKSRLRKKARTKDGIVFSSAGDVFLQGCKAAEFTIDKMGSADKFVQSMVSQALSNRAPSEVSFNEWALATIDAETWVVACKKGWQSFYINSLAVMDFLENSEPRLSDGKLIMQAARDIQDDSAQHGFMIHMPSMKYSIFVYTLKKDDMTIITMRINDEIHYTPISENGEWVENKEFDNLNWNIVFNLFLYMDAFPECVIDGPPEIICGSISGAKQKVINASDVIATVYTQTKITPHMRRGHFRVLKSERFTNKRFQAVYVKPAMVSGKSTTVTEPI